MRTQVLCFYDHISLPLVVGMYPINWTQHIRVFTCQSLNMPDSSSLELLRTVLLWAFLWTVWAFNLLFCDKIRPQTLSSCPSLPSSGIAGLGPCTQLYTSKFAQMGHLWGGRHCLVSARIQVSSALATKPMLLIWIYFLSAEKFKM